MRNQYLLQPTGQYTVGYQDYSCKSLGLPNIHVYYPSEQKLEQRFPYYPKGVSTYQKHIRESKITGTELTLLKMTADIVSLGTLTSVAQPGLKPLQKKQPMIYFIPGIGANAPEYENILCELASHGYIVISLNNSSNSEETPQMAYAKVTRLDERLRTRLITSPIFSLIDFKHVGLLGHSLGGVAAVLGAQQQQEHKRFQAAVALDAPADIAKPRTYNVRRPCSIPMLQMHASTWIKTYSGGYSDYSGLGALRMGPHGYHLVLASAGDSHLYSDHNNFSDRSTLQYHPAIQVFNRHVSEQADAKAAIEAEMIASAIQVGRADGFEIARTINQYLCSFYQTFLLKRPHELFSTPGGMALEHTQFLAWSALNLPVEIGLGEASAADMKLGGIIKSGRESAKEPLISDSESDPQKPSRCCVIL